jgi:hypothetical protein
MTQQVQEFSTPQEALAHYGKKGMKWGVTTKSPVRAAIKSQKAADRSQIAASNKSIGQARKDTMAVGKKARGIIRESKRADTPAARKAAADKYQKEVLETIKSPTFKADYARANTMGKGEMAMHALVFNVYSAVTIPAMRASYAHKRATGPDLELDMAHDILREMRRP